MEGMSSIDQQRLYQRQMQFLAEGNQALTAAFQAAQMGQVQQQSHQVQQIQQAQQAQQQQQQRQQQAQVSNFNSSQIVDITPTLPVKEEPTDDDSMSEGLDSRHPSQTSDLQSTPSPINSDGLDDWILKNFKGEESPLSGKSTGYSSVDSSDANSQPSSPPLITAPWGHNSGNRSQSTDSGILSEYTSNQPFSAKT